MLLSKLIDIIENNQGTVLDLTTHITGNLLDIDLDTDFINDFSGIDKIVQNRFIEALNQKNITEIKSANLQIKATAEIMKMLITSIIEASTIRETLDTNYIRPVLTKYKPCTDLKTIFTLDDTRKLSLVQKGIIEKLCGISADEKGKFNIELAQLIAVRRNMIKFVINGNVVPASIDTNLGDLPSEMQELIGLKLTSAVAQPAATNIGTNQITV